MTKKRRDSVHRNGPRMRGYNTKCFAEKTAAGTGKARHDNGGGSGPLCWPTFITMKGDICRRLWNPAPKARRTAARFIEDVHEIWLMCWHYERPIGDRSG